MARPVDMAAAPLTEFVDNAELWPAGKQRMAAYEGRNGICAFSSHSDYRERTELTMCDSSQRIALSVWLRNGIDLQVDGHGMRVGSRQTLASFLPGAPWCSGFEGASHHVGLLLDPQLMEDLAGEAGMLFFGRIRRHGGVCVLPGDAATLRAAHELDAALMSPASALLREAKSLELLARLLGGEQDQGLPARERQRLQHARDLLLQDPACPPSIAELAQACGLNAFKLKTGFKALFGLPLHAYHQQERMRLAWSLLSSGQMSVSEAGAHVGYSNMSHFGAAFRRVYAILPSELTRARRTR